MTYDWSLYIKEIAITWKYHGLLFGKSLSQLEALEVLEQGEELRSFTSRNIVRLNLIIVEAIIATVHGNIQDVQCGELKWKLQPWNWQIRKSGAKFAAAMWKFQSNDSFRTRLSPLCWTIWRWTAPDEQLLATPIADEWYRRSGIGEGRFSFGADKNPLKMVEVSACSVVAQTCASKTSFTFLSWRFLIMEKGLQ